MSDNKEHVHPVVFWRILHRFSLRKKRLRDSSLPLLRKEQLTESSLHPTFPSGHSDSSFYQHWRLCDQSEIETIVKQRMSSYLPTVQLRMSRDHRTSSPCPNLIFHGVFLYSRYSLQSKLRRRTSRIKTCRSKRMGGSPSAS